MEPTLSNTLGILVAFATLMLLYSIVITSLVQATQAVIRLRSRNLWRVLSRILESERTLESENPSQNAFKVLESCTSAVFKMWDHPGPVLRNLFAPDVTWVDAGQLQRALVDSKLGFTGEQVRSIVAKFGQSENASRKRFQFWTRMLTVAWAAFIAIYFQLSTPQLLTFLSANESTRTELIELSGSVTGEEEAKSTSMFYLEPGRLGEDFLYDWETNSDGTTELFVNWANAAGVLVTILLLSLGAPFWFNTLKYVVSLKDVLAKDTGGKPDKAAPEDLNVDQEIQQTTERIARSDDPLEKTALKAKLSDLRVLKAKMLNV